MEALRRVTGIGGPCFAVSTACSASAKAVGCAQRLLATDTVDAVAGGRRRRAVADHAARLPQPPDPEPGVLPAVLARAPRHQHRRRAPPTCCSSGKATRRSGCSASANPPTRITCRRPIRPARARAARWRGRSRRRASSPDDVDYINAHSPGTRLNDLSEGLAVSALFGRPVPVRVDQGLHRSPAGRGRRDRGGLLDRRRRAGRGSRAASARTRSTPTSASMSDGARGHAVPQRAEQLLRVRGEQRQPVIRQRTPMIPRPRQRERGWERVPN